MRQEMEWYFVRWIRNAGLAPLAGKRLLEVGCGPGGNLLEFLRLGFAPEGLVGCELLDEIARLARSRLPSAVQIITGDAAALDLEPGSFDVVFQSTVFTSILDDRFQSRLADRMWSFVKPGGGLLWSDFVYDNPRNRDVRGVPVRRVRELFPDGKMLVWRTTLAPPVSRVVARLHPSLYTLFNITPLLRTHALCWIRK
jgi:SAM-dependent methyltransferase